jgi:GGDEF domain-containing protein
LINRTDFLATLRTTLDQSYKHHEPVVLMVVCLEGLRGLDDASEWAKRDALVEAVGQTIAAGIRKDDVVGRFSDSQFVALLRRLDVPLAELICRKLLSSIAKAICDFELGKWITPRAGLSGSGFSKPEAEALLREAITGLQQARTKDLLLVSTSPRGRVPHEIQSLSVGEHPGARHPGSRHAGGMRGDPRPAHAGGRRHRPGGG